MARHQVASAREMLMSAPAMMRPDWIRMELPQLDFYLLVFKINEVKSVRLVGQVEPNADEEP